MVKVWDPWVRTIHWGLTASIAVSWLSAGDIHAWSGVTAGGLICVRLALGVSGSRYARFRQFLRPPVRTLTYATGLMNRRKRRYLGHTPLGGLMVVSMILVTLSVALTGFLEIMLGAEAATWLADLHGRLAHILLGCILLHLLGVGLSSLRHRENLVVSMITGRKRAPGPRDVA